MYKPLKVNLNKSYNSDMDLIKSMPTKERKSFIEPPLLLMESINYKDKPSSLTYDTLYQMSTKNSVVGSIINTRVNQVSSFTKPARFSKDNMGYEIRLKNPKAVPTKEQTKIITAIEAFIENCGYDKDNSRDSFDQFTRKVIRDSLTYDQLTFEIIPDRKGRPAEFLAVDASTVRAASEDFHFDGLQNPPKKGEEVAYVQVIDGAVQSWFTSRELAFGVRNPRTSIYMQPYGFSELEQLITQITSHLYAEEYNMKYFSQGGTTKGIINLKQDPNGVMNTEQLESFKRQWRAQVSGITGAWKTPVLQVPNGIEYINVAQSNRDMEFSQWMNYLVNIVCAIYQIDPAEINFANNGGVNSNGGSGLFESNNESKLKNSKDKGLRPLLRFYESLINKHIVSLFSDELVFGFVGIDEKTEEEKIETSLKEIRAFKTIDEVRAEHGLEPLPDGNGDTILDASYMNYVAQKSMSMGGMDGMMGEQSEDENFSINEDESEEPEQPTEEPENSSPDEENDEDSYSDYSVEESNVEDTEEENDYSNYSAPEDEDEDDYNNYSVDDIEKSLSRLVLDIE